MIFKRSNPKTFNNETKKYISYGTVVKKKIRFVSHMIDNHIAQLGGHFTTSKRVDGPKYITAFATSEVLTPSHYFGYPLAQRRTRVYKDSLT